MAHLDGLTSMNVFLTQHVRITQYIVGPKIWPEWFGSRTSICISEHAIFIPISDTTKVKLYSSLRISKFFGTWHCVPRCYTRAETFGLQLQPWTPPGNVCAIFILTECTMLGDHRLFQSYSYICQHGSTCWEMQLYLWSTSDTSSRMGST